MRNLLRRSMIVAAATAPIAALSIMTAAISSADPPNCGYPQFWDPITNTCQTPRPAEACPWGEYWNALSNVCRPLGQL
jgi:hypothetical protein